MLSAKNTLLSEIARQQGLVDDATLGRHIKETMAEELNNSSRSLARVLLDAGVLDRKHYNVLIRAYNSEVRQRRGKKSTSPDRRAKRVSRVSKATPAPTISFPKKTPPEPPATGPTAPDEPPESAPPSADSDTEEPLLTSGWSPTGSSASKPGSASSPDMRGESSDLKLDVPDSDDQTSPEFGNVGSLCLDSDSDAVPGVPAPPATPEPLPQPSPDIPAAESLEELSDDFALELAPSDSGQQRASPFEAELDPTMDIAEEAPPVAKPTAAAAAELSVPATAPRKRFKMPDKIEVRTESEDLCSPDPDGSHDGDSPLRIGPTAGPPTRVLTQADLRRGLRDGSAFAGTRVGDYVVDSEVSRGGMGVVLRARPTGLAEIMFRERGFDGPICLKIILPAHEEPDPQEIDRFQQEVRSLTNLQHKNIVRIFDSGMENDLYFYAMELINGDSTRELVRDGNPPPPLLTIRIITECAMALDAIHKAGVLHRDIKPSNILIDKDASPYRSVLIDFGLVKQTGTKSEKGIIVGTPSYMPPEQARPRRKKYGQIDPTSDLYSLGATFYYLLTGRPPFDHRDPRKCIKMVCEKAPIDPAELVEGLPRKVADICLKCLEKKQSDRYGSASKLIVDLQQLERRGRRTLQIRSYLDRWFGSREPQPRRES